MADFAAGAALTGLAGLATQYFKKRHHSSNPDYLSPSKKTKLSPQGRTLRSNLPSNVPLKKGMAGVGLHRLRLLRKRRPRQRAYARLKKRAQKLNARRRKTDRKVARLAKKPTVKRYKALNMSKVKTMVLKMLNPPQAYTAETHIACQLSSNNTEIHDMTIVSDQAGVQGFGEFGVNVFYSQKHLEAVYNAIYTPATFSTREEFWVMKGSRYFELTNLSNCDMYIKIHEYTCKNDCMVTPLAIAESVGQDVNNYPGVLPFTLDANNRNYKIISTQLFTDILALPDISRNIAKYYKHRVKKMVLPPQGQVSHVLANRKPFLYRQRQSLGQEFNTAIPNVAVTNVLNTTRYMKGVTKFVYLEVVGQTQIGGPAAVPVAGTHVSAASGTYDIAWKDHFVLMPRSVAVPEHRFSAVTFSPANATNGFSAQGNTFAQVI